MSERSPDGRFLKHPGSPDFPLFHWSPTSRRKQIIRYGLRPSCRSTVSVLWRPRYVCFADTPSWAWALSGSFHPEIGSWDLWQVWRSVAPMEEKPGYGTREGRIHEYRAYVRIFKRHVWYVATRTTGGEA